jgi:hypothetical protein
MATSIDDLLQIHSRFPILAFLLSLCNPSTISMGLSSPPPDKRVLRKERSAGLREIIAHARRITILGCHLPLSMLLHDILLHACASGFVVLSVWQAVILGQRGVIVFACKGWYQPATWVLVGTLSHLLNVICWRCCLGPIKGSRGNRWTRWSWNISESGGNLEIKHPKIARFFQLAFQVIGLMNYGYGTVMLSGTSLVDPVNALKVFCRLGFAGLGSRLIAIWVLNVFPDVRVIEEFPSGTSNDGKSHLVEEVGLQNRSFSEDRQLRSF